MFIGNNYDTINFIHTKKVLNTVFSAYIFAYLELIYISNMIKVSDIAKKKVIELMKDDGFNPENDYVRVGVKSGGCSGLSYDLKFENEQIKAFIFQRKNIQKWVNLLKTI